VPKVHNKPIKRLRKGSNKESKRQPKGTLVWRTGLSGVPPDSVRCTRTLEAELFTFGKFRGRSAIIHRTVRCASGATATSRTTVICNRIQCATVRARVRARVVGAPDSLQDLSGAPPDSPEAPQVRAPTVEPQRSADVAGAPDCPVHHATTHFQRPFLVVGAINTPTTPHSMASKFLHFYTLQELYHSIQDTPKRSNPLPTPHKALVIREREICCVHLSSCTWIASFLSHSSCDKLNCNRGKRHQLCGGPCGNLVFRLIEKRSSLSLSNRLREGKG
jgi:hypothetical protein